MDRRKHSRRSTKHKGISSLGRRTSPKIGGAEGKNLKKLTDKVFEAPWDLTKDEIRTISQYSPDELALTIDDLTQSAAELILEMVQQMK